MDLVAIEREYRRQVKYPMLTAHEARRDAGLGRLRSMTYGTTSAKAAAKILAWAGARHDDVFYDLGCGLGVPTMVAASICRRATGIDVLAPLTRAARGVASALGLHNARFISGDLTKANVRDGTLFYSYATCFSNDLLAALAANVATAAPGAKVLTVTHQLKHPDLELVKSASVRWLRLAHVVYLHVRR